jgi:hypothetical protein
MRFFFGEILVHHNAQFAKFVAEGGTAEAEQFAGLGQVKVRVPQHSREQNAVHSLNAPFIHSALALAQLDFDPSLQVERSRCHGSWLEGRALDELLR